LQGKKKTTKTKKQDEEAEATNKKKKTNKRVVLGLRFGKGGWLGRIGVHLLGLCNFRLSTVSMLL
jgi:hypothetical protein